MKLPEVLDLWGFDELSCSRKRHVKSSVDNIFIHMNRTLTFQSASQSVHQTHHSLVNAKNSLFHTPTVFVTKNFRAKEKSRNKIPHRIHQRFIEIGRQWPALPATITKMHINTVGPNARDLNTRDRNRSAVPQLHMHTSRWSRNSIIIISGSSSSQQPAWLSRALYCRVDSGDQHTTHRPLLALR